MSSTGNNQFTQLLDKLSVKDSNANNDKPSLKEKMVDKAETLVGKTEIGKQWLNEKDLKNYKKEMCDELKDESNKDKYERVFNKVENSHKNKNKTEKESNAPNLKEYGMKFKNTMEELIGKTKTGHNWLKKIDKKKYKNKMIEENHLSKDKKEIYEKMFDKIENPKKVKHGSDSNTGESSGNNHETKESMTDKVKDATVSFIGKGKTGHKLLKKMEKKEYKKEMIAENNLKSENKEIYDKLFNKIEQRNNKQKGKEYQLNVPKNLHQKLVTVNVNTPKAA